MTTHIRLVLEVDDPEDEDRDHRTGLTAEATDRLIDAIADAGFSIVQGPDRQ